MRIAAKVAQHKLEKPWQYCTAHRCLWRTGNAEHSPENPAPRCPRHPSS